MSHVESRPMLFCSDEDVQFETRMSEGNDYDVAVHLRARPIGGNGAPLVDVYVPARVWRQWVRAVERQIKAEYASRPVRDDEEDDS